MFRILLFTVMCSFLLTACGNQTNQSDDSSDMMDKGLAAIAANDLGKAEGIFESVSDNEKAQKYYEQIVLLREGQKLLESGHVEEGTAKLEAAMNYEGGSELLTTIAKDTLAMATESDMDTENVSEKPVEENKNSNPAKTVDVISDKASGMQYVQLANEKGNVREQPSIDSKVVHSGKLGDVFVYLQEKVNTPDGRTWYKVEYSSGYIGYISRAVSNLTNEIPSYVRLTENGTNIRSAPSLDATILYTGQKNDTFYFSNDKTYTKDGRTWLHIWLPNGQYGYVSQKVATMTTAYSPTIQSTHYGSTIIVTAEVANVRAYPSIDSSIILKNIPKGETFTYTGYYYDTSDGRTWYEVELYNPHLYGYISKAVGKIQ